MRLLSIMHYRYISFGANVLPQLRLFFHKRIRDEMEIIEKKMATKNSSSKKEVKTEKEKEERGSILTPIETILLPLCNGMTTEEYQRIYAMIQNFDLLDKEKLEGLYLVAKVVKDVESSGLKELFVRNESEFRSKMHRQLVIAYKEIVAAKDMSKSEDY